MGGGPSLQIFLGAVPYRALQTRLIAAEPHMFLSGGGFVPRPALFLLFHFWDKYQSIQWHKNMPVYNSWRLILFYWSEVHLCCPSVACCFICYTLISCDFPVHLEKNTKASLFPSLLGAMPLHSFEECSMKQTSLFVLISVKQSISSNSLFPGFSFPSSELFPSYGCLHLPRDGRVSNVCHIIQAFSELRSQV